MAVQAEWVWLEVNTHRRHRAADPETDPGDLGARTGHPLRSNIWIGRVYAGTRRTSSPLSGVGTDWINASSCPATRIRAQPLLLLFYGPQPPPTFRGLLLRPQLRVSPAPYGRGPSQPMLCTICRQHSTSLRIGGEVGWGFPRAVLLGASFPLD
jgi:hypothetical protein